MFSHLNHLLNHFKLFTNTFSIYLKEDGSTKSTIIWCKVVLEFQLQTEYLQIVKWIRSKLITCSTSTHKKNWWHTVLESWKLIQWMKFGETIQKSRYKMNSYCHRQLNSTQKNQVISNLLSVFSCTWFFLKFIKCSLISKANLLLWVSCQQLSPYQ